MTSRQDSFLCSVPLPDEALELHAFDERWIVPTARAIANIWTADNARLRLLKLEPDDVYLLALDQCLSAFAAGEGVIATNSAGQIVALCLSCDAVVIEGNENAVVWIDPAAFSPATRAYKAQMDALYRPFLSSFQEFLSVEGYTHTRGVITYGLKGGVDARYRGHKLLPLLLSVTAALARLSGFRWYAGIATHPITASYHERRSIDGHSRTLHQARLADFVDPVSGQRPYEDAGDLHFVLGVMENSADIPRALGDEGTSRLRRWHADWQRSLPDRERRARELVAILAPPRAHRV